MDDRQSQTQIRRRRWRREPVAMGEGQQFVYRLFQSPIGRISTIIVLLISFVGGWVFGNMIARGLICGWVVCQIVVFSAAKAYDKKNQPPEA